jgi:two-component system, OmpR family, response regulator
MIKKKVLIIDDDEDLCLLFKAYLVKKDYEVFLSHNLREGLQSVTSVYPDLIFLDNNLPDGMGWEKADDISHSYPSAEIHLITAYPVDLKIKIPSHFKVWEKPITLKDLETHLN